VTEARRLQPSDAGTDGSEFGEARLAESLRSRLEEPLADLPARLLEEVEAFAGPEPQDDRTIVTLRARA
jgi:serine phosphatase RsbU (regulator of sigma subunit)